MRIVQTFWTAGQDPLKKMFSFGVTFLQFSRLKGKNQM